MSRKTLLMIEACDDPEQCNADYNFVSVTASSVELECAGANELQEAAVAARRFVQRAEERLERIRRAEARLNGDAI